MKKTKLGSTTYATEIVFGAPAGVGKKVLNNDPAERPLLGMAAKLPLRGVFG